jgi:alpha-1,6-mannosyltransferase
MTIATVIFRAEIALLLFGHCLIVLLRSAGSFSAIASSLSGILVPAVLTASAVGLVLTGSVDTFMWRSQKLLWPEAAAFLSNVFPPPGSQGASAWGTSPWHWYFTSALPRLTATPLIFFLPWCMILPTPIHPQVFSLMLPAMVYTGLYSILPHKETRFLFPILPTVNTALALIASLSTTTAKALISFRRFIAPVLALSTLATFLASHFILLPLSAISYPGGQALNLLQTYAATIPPFQSSINIHLTNLALQTGVTRFLEHPPPSHSYNTTSPIPRATTAHWTYDKSDNSTGSYLQPSFWSKFDYLIVEPDVANALSGSGAQFATVPAFEVIGEVLALGRPRLADLKDITTITDTHIGHNAAAFKLRSYHGVQHSDDELALLLRRMYGDSLLARVAVGVYKLLKSVGTSKLAQKATKGIWVGWQEEVALVVLRRKSLIADGPADAMQVQ